MIFAPTHPLCHMAYECGVGAQKRFSRFAGPKTVLRIWRFLLFRIWMLSLLAPLLLGAHGFFFSLAELFATEALPFWKSFFYCFFAKKREGLRLSFRFFQAASLSSSLSASRTRSSRARVFFSLIFHRQT